MPNAREKQASDIPFTHRFRTRDKVKAFSLSTMLMERDLHVSGIFLKTRKTWNCAWYYGV